MNDPEQAARQWADEENARACALWGVKARSNRKSEVARNKTRDEFGRFAGEDPADDSEPAE